MVGTLAGVFFDAPSELGKNHHCDISRSPDAPHVHHESPDRIGCVHQQTGVQVGLMHVRVKGVSAVGHVVHLGWQSGGDQGCHFAQITRQSSGDAVVDRGPVGTPCVSHQSTAVRSVARDGAQECQS